jgi:hypothetical protein
LVLALVLGLAPLLAVAPLLGLELGQLLVVGLAAASVQLLVLVLRRLQQEYLGEESSPRQDMGQ